jgi:hypothetical protein
MLKFLAGLIVGLVVGFMFAVERVVAREKEPPNTGP